MAYCVHCGVKLGESEKRCPLCLTPVFDPAQPRDPSAPRPYPVHTPEQELKRNKRFLLMLATFMLAAPALLCLLIDCMITGSITWSGYASGALLMLYFSAAVPLLAARHTAWWTVGTVFLSLNGYLFLVERLSQSGPWFFPIALPALALGTALAAALILLYRKEWLNLLTLIAALFVAVAAECVAIEWLHSLTVEAGRMLVWSPFVVAPCLFIALALAFINYNRAVREEVRRRVHF